MPAAVAGAVSVVVPVFQSETTLIELARRIDAALAPRFPFEVLLVDDGGPETTWAVILELTRANPKVRGIRLSRNFGQHNAILSGVRAARYPVVVTIDDDLQNPPEEIPRLVDSLIEGDLDVVYGVPESISQTVSRRVASRLSKAIMRAGLGVTAAPDVSSFRAFQTRLRDAFNQDVGTNVSLDALLTWGGSRFGAIRVRHDPRSAGISNYTLPRLVRFAIDTATGYSTIPLQVASVMGLVAASFGVAVLVYVIGRVLITGESVPGFPFLASTIAIFSGTQLLTLGIIGEYLARMHFRVMRKPTYVIRETAGTVSDDYSGDASADRPL